MVHATQPPMDPCFPSPCFNGLRPVFKRFSLLFPRVSVEIRQYPGLEQVTHGTYVTCEWLRHIPQLFWLKATQYKGLVDKRMEQDRKGLRY